MEYCNWIVSPEERQLYDQIFSTLDPENNGFIVGTNDNVRKIFLKTQLVHTVLAHIWNLCDIRQNGKLNSEQFALAMHFVSEAKKGNELPNVLTPEMIPPTLRPKPKSGFEHQESVNKQQIPETNKFSNKELELLAEELKELESEKHNLECEVTQQETQMKLRESEIKSIKNEIETMLQMIKQLETQKVEAAKRLDEMENQTVILREQNKEQKERNEIEEAELKVKKDEFESLKSEEQQYETKVNDLKKEIEKISNEIADSQLLVCKYKAKAIDLEEYENHLKEENKEFDICIASKDVNRLNALIAKQLQAPELNASTTKDGFNDNTEFPSFSQNEFAADPFSGEDPFSGDPFANAFGKSNTSDFNDPFNSRSAFGDNESTPELPPKPKKNSGGPPPRPAPPSKPALPKNVDPWGNPIQEDPFAVSSSSNQSNTGFADFANFEPFASPSNQSDPFSPIKSNVNKTKINKEFDPFADFSSKFDDNKFESNWSTSFQSNNLNQSNNLDPFAPTVNNNQNQLNFFDLDEDKKRKEKQIQDDYELALRLSKR